MLAMQTYYIVDKQTESFIKITIYLILEESRITVILKVWLKLLLRQRKSIGCYYKMSGSGSTSGLSRLRVYM